jgi:hypothetical protein
VKNLPCLKWPVLPLALFVGCLFVWGCAAPQEVIVAGAAVTVEARALSADVLATYPDANARPVFAQRTLSSAERIRTLMVPVRGYLADQRPDSNSR